MWRAVSVCQRAAPSWGHSKHSESLENKERCREESRGVLSKEGAQLYWSAHKQRNTQGQQKDARGVPEFLPSKSYWQLISYPSPHFSREIKFSVQTPGRERDFHLPWRNITPEVYTQIPVICTLLPLVSVVNFWQYQTFKSRFKGKIRK